MIIIKKEREKKNRNREKEREGHYRDIIIDGGERDVVISYSVFSHHQFCGSGFSSRAALPQGLTSAFLGLNGSKV